MKTIAEKTEFSPCSLRYWDGRYGRIVGGCHWTVKNIGGRWRAAICWNDGDYDLECRAIECPDTERMASAVAAGKRYLGDSGGGSFVINEFGQVIVPSSLGDGRRVIVGEVTGKILIENPLANSASDKWLRIWQDNGLSAGDPWEMPYVGAQYNLNKWSRIYYYRTSEGGGASEFPAIQDEALILALRRIRRTGPVRFLVNPYGIVLTKCPNGDTWTSDEHWKPVYVGRINYTQWFRKES